MIAFIPARSGSTRLPDKNIKALNGYPLIAYSIHSALASGVFEDVYVSTDSKVYADIASYYGAKIIIEPLPNGLGDINWVENAFETIKCNSFAILRPTSPFRTAETIKRAYKLFNDGNQWYDSLRAVEKCKQHPNKMWTLTSGGLRSYTGEHLYSQPYQSLPEVYVQNASLEMAWSYCVTRYRSISGLNIRPFITQGYEGFDINYEIDLLTADMLISQGLVNLPVIGVPYKISQIIPMIDNGMLSRE